jgi:hypothetical protein
VPAEETVWTTLHNMRAAPEAGRLGSPSGETVGGTVLGSRATGAACPGRTGGSVAQAGLGQQQSRKMYTAGHSENCGTFYGPHDDSRKV